MSRVVIAEEQAVTKLGRHKLIDKVEAIQQNEGVIQNMEKAINLIELELRAMEDKMKEAEIFNTMENYIVDYERVREELEEWKETQRKELARYRSQEGREVRVEERTLREREAWMRQAYNQIEGKCKDTEEEVMQLVGRRFKEEKY